jgi:hypothetical protein
MSKARENHPGPGENFHLSLVDEVKRLVTSLVLCLWSLLSIPTIN